MCGLTGFLLRAGTNLPGDLGMIADRMADTLRHRGPDDRGIWADPGAGIAIGHRRLSIIDLSPLGAQPMTSSCGRYVIAFNGEIYGFTEIRRELEQGGRSFRGQSDTEVMLEAIAEWGLERALERFNGMFAFAVWDRHERALTLARDRLGIKPLYYGWSGTTCLFGSELKALVAYPGFRREVDRDALALFMRHGYVPSPHSIYRGIFKLPAASWVSISASTVEPPTPVVYWSARRAAVSGRLAPFDGSENEAVDALDAALRASVKLQMIADVPLGAFLSGGVDSSTVVALMQATAARPVRTFTVGFREPGHDESAHARAVAEHLRTDHTELFVEPRHVLDLVPAIPEWYDEPFADPSELPTYLISALTRRHVTVSLSGDGGDELFAGYDGYDWTRRVWDRLMIVPQPLRRPLGRVLERIPPRGRFATKLQLAGELLALDRPDAAYLRLQSHWRTPESVVIGSREPARALWDDSLPHEVLDLLSQMQLVDIGSYLPDDVLTKVDRASMAVSLEARVPILDHRVVELAWRFPVELRVRDGQRKWVLRRVLERYVPRGLVDRPKMGFGVPIAAWLRGELREWAETLLDERRLREGGILDAAPIRRAWREHLDGRRSCHYPLWDVLMFQAWKEHWLGG